MSKAIFEKYIEDLKAKQKKDEKGNYVVANPWAKTKKPAFWNDCWEKLQQTGLQFDGKHITIDTNGLNFDYVAYKNKMLLVYPESLIDLELVYKGDEFSFRKDNGIVNYHHSFANPFNHKDEDIVGGYCVIKNKRGEFITVLSKDEILKARAVAKTHTIWKAWFSEMCKKTVIKKAVKFHFDDIYAVMEEEDNKNYDLDKAEAAPEPEMQDALKNAIAEAASVKILHNIYNREYDNLATQKIKNEFVSLCTLRKKELNNANS